jgi:hypothetical protein
MFERIQNVYRAIVAWIKKTDSVFDNETHDEWLDRNAW